MRYAACLVPALCLALATPILVQPARAAEGGGGAGDTAQQHATSGDQESGSAVASGCFAGSSTGCNHAPTAQSKATPAQGFNPQQPALPEAARAPE